jgi:hypothetical protein
VAALTLAHLVDHVLRADASGWPFTGEVTWFTASLVLFPVLVAGILLLRPAAAGERARPPRRPAGRARPGGFLRSTGTTAFLAVKGDTLVAEAYFHGYRHDSTVSSFSVAKPVVSALVGIAIAQGRIGSVDDPVTRYLPELARRDPRFGRITLRHLLTMSSGLADLDPYYDLTSEPWPCGTPGSSSCPASGSATTTSTRSCSAWSWSGPPERRPRRTWPNSCGAAGHGGRRLLEPGQPPVGAGAAGGRAQRPRRRLRQARRPRWTRAAGPPAVPEVPEILGRRRSRLVVTTDLAVHGHRARHAPLSSRSAGMVPGGPRTTSPRSVVRP